MVAVRSKSKEVCKGCKTKACLVGNENGWGCPWYQHMEKMDRNNYCGMCMECVKSCPNDNITVYARPMASDTKLKGYDEVWKGFIMLVLALAYSIILLGPYGTLKDWANVSEMRNYGGFGVYASVVWFSALVGLPLVYYFAIFLGHRLSKSTATMKETFIGYGYTLVPLGLFAWIAFSVPLVMVNGSYIISIISDPLGWGWDIFGTADVHWSPFFPEYAVFLQIILLATGLYFSITRVFSIAMKLNGKPYLALKSILPLCVLLLAITILFVLLYVG